MVVVMSKSHTEALRKRWQDPAYRERQTESNQRASAQRQKQLSDPLERKRLALAVRQARRKRSG